MGRQTYKVYATDGEYIASCDYIEDAVEIVIRRGAGAFVRHDGHAKWQTIYTFPKEIPANYTRKAIRREILQEKDVVQADRQRLIKESQDKYDRRHES